MSHGTCGSASGGRCRRCSLVRLLLLVSVWLAARGIASGADPRLRTVLYDPDEVYRLPARVGYEIELEFQAGERFLGLGAGDAAGITFKAEANHLFIKPKAANVHTNVTVLTDRRTYRFDYTTLVPDQTIDQIDTVYALRFLYPIAPAIAPIPNSPAESAARAAEALLQASPARSERNLDYWYCGAPQLKPVASWDDGVQTHLLFGVHAEIPAVFVVNDDGTESLVNFNIVKDEMVVHRIARRLLLRRGRLLGCVLNRSFSGSGDSLSSNTISPRVERKLRDTSNQAPR